MGKVFTDLALRGKTMCNFKTYEEQREKVKTYLLQSTDKELEYFNNMIEQELKERHREDK